MTAAPERTAGVDTATLERELSQQLDGEVAFDDYTRHLFSQDASMYTMTPVGVVYPRHVADVVAAVRLAGEAGLPVLARGADRTSRPIAAMTNGCCTICAASVRA